MSDQEDEKKGREPKKNSIPMTEVETLCEGLPQYTKTSFLVVGHRNGVRIAMPKTAGVSRAYFYGDDDYAGVPKHPAITVFSEEARKAGRKGGIMAEVDFDAGVEAARQALALLVAAVRKAPTPAPKAVKAPKAPKAPREPKQPKVAKAAQPAKPVTEPSADAEDDGGDADSAAEASD